MRSPPPNVRPKCYLKSPAPAQETDPFERADITSNTYYDWFLSKGYRFLAAQAIVGAFMETFKAFPPRQKAASFTIDQAHDKITSATASK